MRNVKILFQKVSLNIIIMTKHAKLCPEHASIQTKAPKTYVEKIKYVGALFLGHYSPEVIGDYVAGPSHVLPTNQTARFSNGLTVNDFMTRNSVIQLTQQTFKRGRAFSRTHCTY